MKADDSESTRKVAGEVAVGEPSKVLPSSVAHWGLFLPAIAVAVLYFSAWGLLAIAGERDSELSRLTLLVAFLVPPLLGAHAFFRYETARFSNEQGRILVNKGGFRSLAEFIDYGDVADISLRKGVLTGRFGMATVRIRLKSGKIVVVAGLANPERAVAAAKAQLTGGPDRQEPNFKQETPK